jgi:hypothetical protein
MADFLFNNKKWISAIKYTVTGPLYSTTRIITYNPSFGPVFSRSSYLDSLIMYNTSIKTMDEILNEFIKADVEVKYGLIVVDNKQSNSIVTIPTSFHT